MEDRMHSSTAHPNGFSALAAAFSEEAQDDTDCDKSCLHTMGESSNNNKESEQVQRKSLALNSHMDFITLAGLLRDTSFSCHNDDDDHFTENGTLRKEELSLYRVELDYNTAHEVLDQLHRFESVELAYCEGDHVDKVIAKCLQADDCTVTTLNFCAEMELDNATIDAFCIGLAQLTTKLQHLKLTMDLPTDLTGKLCHAINKCPSLQTLDLSQCEFDANGAIDQLCLALKEASSLSNGDNNLQRQGAGGLKSLLLNNCRLEDDEVANIAHALTNHPTLQKLSLRMNYAEGEAMLAIAELIRCTPKLQSLDLAQQNPGVLDLRPLFAALADNGTLQKLNLQENYLYDAHMQSLVQAMNHNTTLQELNLENCELGDAAFIILLQGLEDWQGLSKLWLRENRFSHNKDIIVIESDDCETTTLAAAATISSKILQNQTLQRLDVEEEILVPNPLRRVLELNRGGRQCLTPNVVPLSLWPTLLARINRIFPQPESTTTTTPAESPVSCSDDNDIGDDNGRGPAKILQTCNVDMLFYMLRGPALLDR